MANEDHAVENTPEPSLSSVRAFDDAVGALVSGRLIVESVGEINRPYLACFYGGPFYALMKLAPELFDKPIINIVFGGLLTRIPDDGGRWLSLFRKVLPYEGRIICTICSPPKPKFGRPLRPLLAQMPQPVIAKTWTRHLHESGVIPDILILYPPSTFGEFKGFIDSICQAGLGCKLLIACRSRVDVIIIYRLFLSYGFSVGEPVGFPKSDGEVQAFADGAWWLSVGARQEGGQIPAEREIARLRSVHRAFRDAMDEAAGYINATAIATSYGRRSAVQVGDAHVPDSVFVSDAVGIDLSNGRYFHRADSSAEVSVPSYSYGDDSVPTAILGLVPQRKNDESELESEFRLLTWMARVGESETEDYEDSISLDDVDAGGEDSIDISGSESGSSSGAAEPIESPSTIVPIIDEQQGGAAPQHTARSIERSRLLRARLSRAAGTINVLAVAAGLGGRLEEGENGYAEAQARILEWLEIKGFADVPVDVNYHLETPDGEVSVETDGNEIWALRFDDRKQMEGGAFWRVELALIRSVRPALGLRLYQVRRSEESPPPVSGVPKFLATIADKVGLVDYGVPLLPSVVRLVGWHGAKTLLDLLLNAYRVQPVIVISTSREMISEITMNRLAERLVGAAHVVWIDYSISDALVREFGRERSVFGSAIRLYRPGFSSDSDPFQHRIWTYFGGRLPRYQIEDIVEEVFAISLEGGCLDTRTPSFVAIRNTIGEKRLIELRSRAKKSSATVEEERAKQLEIQKNLEKRLEQQQEWTMELEKRNELVELELRTLSAERDEALEQARRLRRKLGEQFQPVYSAEGDVSDDATWYPDSFDALEEWVEYFGDGKLELLPSAIKAAKESSFHVELSYKALEFLVKFYVPMRQRTRDDVDARLKFNQALNDLGIECSQTGDAATQHRYKSDYKRLYEGRAIVLDMHLKRGAGFDPAVVFRLYFYYDDSAGKVIVGHFPSHLTNSKTH